VNAECGEPSAKDDERCDQQPEKKRHQQRGNKPFSKIEFVIVEHWTAYHFRREHKLSVIDNSPGRAMMPQTVASRWLISEANRNFVVGTTNGTS
jgi:hypothetical protein